MVTVDVIDALNNSHLSRYLSHEEIQSLVTHNKIMSFESGDTILKQGEKMHGMFVIIEGEATVTAKVLGEGISKQAILKKGDFIGAMSLIEKQQSTTTVVASKPVECLLISQAYFDMLAYFFPETKYKFTIAILKGIRLRIETLYTKITDYMEQTQMVERSFFGEVILSLTHQSLATFEELNIDKKWLQQLESFASFNQIEFDTLLSRSSLIKAPKNCALIQEGERNSACFFILFGAVQSSIIKHNKVAKLTVTAPMNWISSFIPLEEQNTSIINYTTRERAILLKLTRDDIDFLQHTHLELWYKLFDQLCKAFLDIKRAAEKLDIRLNSELYNR